MEYRVRVEARMDILGEVVDRFNVTVPYIGKKAAIERAEQIAHEERCQKYGMPVHFVAIRTTLV